MTQAGLSKREECVMGDFLLFLARVAAIIVLVVVGVLVIDYFTGVLSHLRLAPGQQVQYGGDASDDHAPPTEAPGTPVCDVPGSVFVKEIGKCVYTMTDPVEVQKYSPDKDVDPRCKGKPAGFRYDVPVVDHET